MSENPFDPKKINTKKPYEKPTITKMVDGISLPLEQKLPTPEPPNPKPEDENLIEKELSPEQIEKIMEKVRDIDEYGTAYTVLTGFRVGRNILNDIKNILKKGVFGSVKNSSNQTIEDTHTEINQRFSRDIRKKDIRGPLVYFNIVGRAAEKMQVGKTEISQSTWFNAKSSIGLAVIFDLSHYNETLPMGKSTSMRYHTYQVDEPYIRNEYGGLIETYRNQLSESELYKKVSEEIRSDEKDWSYKLNDTHVDKFGKLKSHTEEGFVLYPNISSPLFRGFIIRSEEKIDNQEIVENLVQQMLDVYKNKKELLIPIYNSNGDLLWPKQMSYEEVKRFVEERDKKKEE